MRVSLFGPMLRDQTMAAHPIPAGCSPAGLRRCWRDRIARGA